MRTETGLEDLNLSKLYVDETAMKNDVKSAYVSAVALEREVQHLIDDMLALPCTSSKVSIAKEQAMQYTKSMPLSKLKSLFKTIMEALRE